MRCDSHGVILKVCKKQGGNCAYPFIILRRMRDRGQEKKKMVIFIAAMHRGTNCDLCSRQWMQVMGEILPQSRSHKLFPSHSDEGHSTDAASGSPAE